MRVCAFVLFCCFFGIGQPGLIAQIANSVQKHPAPDIPAVIVSGLEAYKQKGPEEAVRILIKDGPLDGSKDALGQANILRQVQDYYGTYRNYEFISSREISTTTRVFYLILKYDKGPLFSKFVVYRSDQGWIMTNFLFNTKEEAVFPTIVQNSN